MSAERTAGAQSVRRAMAVLRILATGQDSGVRLTDIVEQSGLERPTVHRLLRALAEEGAVEQDAETRRYLIGREISALGIARTSRFPLRAAADPYLRHLADELGDTVFLTIRSGPDSICIDRKTGDYPVKVLSLEIGGRRPLGVGVGGIALLARMAPEDAAAAVRENVQRFVAFDVTLDWVLDRVRTARSRGYAYREQGIVKGTRAVAVAVDGPDGEPVGAISVAGVANRLSSTRLPAVVAAMREQAALIKRRLGTIARSRKRA
jgi:DNA-binding IclR family transcriptional regulator